MGGTSTSAGFDPMSNHWISNVPKDIWSYFGYIFWMSLSILIPPYLILVISIPYSIGLLGWTIGTSDKNGNYYNNGYAKVWKEFGMDDWGIQAYWNMWNLDAQWEYFWVFVFAAIFGPVYWILDIIFRLIDGRLSF